jgi:hypothetical protein
MTETKSLVDIATECREVSERVMDLATDFDYYATWNDHCQHLISISALLQIYAHHLDSKCAALAADGQ